MKLDTDILSANKAEVVSIRIRRGETRIKETKSLETKLKCQINKLSELLRYLKRHKAYPNRSRTGKEVLERAFLEFHN